MGRFEGEKNKTALTADFLKKHPLRKKRNLLKCSLN
jgi:hypothetical protein